MHNDELDIILILTDHIMWEKKRKNINVPIRINFIWAENPVVES